MKSKSKIEFQLRNKRNPELVQTIIAAKKNEAWHRLAEILSGSRRARAEINLEQINEVAGDSEIIIIPGKVLSQGKLDKKMKIAALNFSESAREKISHSKGECLSILEEIKKNPSAKGIKILGDKK